MKRRISLVCPFYCSLRLQIYEAFAANFWQSVSYVTFILFPGEIITLLTSPIEKKNIWELEWRWKQAYLNTLIVFTE